MYDTVDIPDTHTEIAEEWRAKLIETVAEDDDELMELFLEGDEPTEEQLVRRHPPRHHRRQRSPRSSAAPRSRTRASSPCSTRS